MNTMARINSGRLWDSLMRMAEIGRTEKGGCNRQALTDLDRAGRDLFVGWCKDAGCRVRVDQMGNIFARRAGRVVEAAPVLTGSHLDTQPTGGKFDGVYGVLAGLEVVRSMNDAGITTAYPVDVVCWTNEEGARFSPAMIGSGVWAGVFDLEYGHGRADRSGASIATELKRIGYLGDTPCGAGPIKAAFEVHIEQGPILEQAGLQIGIVTGVQGMRWYDIVIEGEACHAGTTPMEVRRDPVQALGSIIAGMQGLAAAHSPRIRITSGQCEFKPGSRNTVPERVTMSVDLRHPEQRILDQVEAALTAIVLEASAAARVSGSVRKEWDAAAIDFAPECINSVQRAVDHLGYRHKRMASGAGHDSVNVSRVAPASMIFVPCEGGLSHNEMENARQDDLESGCNVLLHAILDQAVLVPR